MFSHFRFKDFASEVRGNMDVEALLDDAAVLLDLTETSLERIIHPILNKTLDILDAPLAYEEAMSTLFLPESGNILAKTIQVSPNWTSLAGIRTVVLQFPIFKQNNLAKLAGREAWKVHI